LFFGHSFRRALVLATAATVLPISLAAQNASSQSSEQRLPAKSSVLPAVETGSDGRSAVDGAASNLLVRPETQVGARIGLRKSKLAGKYDLSRIGDRGIGAGMNFYSLDKETALGKEISEDVERQSRIIHDPIIEEYINRVAQNIVHNSDAKVPFTIKVIQNDEVNAFALPGGFFYVNSGLILAAESESELAGVMAHEIAHVAARHATRGETKRDIWNLASIPLVFVGGPIGYAVQQAAGLAVPMGFMKFSRDAEREADLLGLEYDYVSGYDPASFVQFFEKINSIDKKKPNFLAKAFATHPMTDDRIRRAQDAIQTLLPAKEEYIVDTSEFQDVKARLSMLVNNGKQIELGRPVLHHASRDGDSPDANDAQDPNRAVLKKKPN
jgi:beta-barrel assembly-enhancing protease